MHQTRPILACLLLAAACRSGAPAPAAGDGADSAATERFLGADPTVAAQPGEARAGVVRDGRAGEAALIGGLTSEGRAGDIKLYNSVVQVIIQGAYEGHGYIDGGGAVIDVDRVRHDALERDLVEDIFLGISFARLFHADRVEVVSDGSDGGAAVVRATGTDVPWKFIQGLFEYERPTVPDLGLDIEVVYTLEPDSDVLDITTTVTNGGDASVSFTPQDGSFSSGEDLLPWATGDGFGPLATGPVDAAIFTGRQGEATWSSWSPAGDLSLSVLASITADLGIFVADRPPVTLDPGEQTVFVRRLAVTPDPMAAEGLRRAETGEALAPVTGRVTSGGDGVAGVRVHLVDADGAVAGFALSDAAGGWLARLPPGDWTAYAVAHGGAEQVDRPLGAGRYGPFAARSVNDAQLAVLDGRATAAPLPFAVGRAAPPPTGFSLPAAGASVDLTVPPASALQVRLVDGDGAPVPGVVDVRWEAGAPPPGTVPAELADALGVDTGGRAFWGWTATGALTLPALPGAYVVSAGHSWRHERDQATVVVAEGATESLTLVLDEAVPRDGWLALDPHLHGSPSFDGALPMEDRLITCAATGVELPVTTDHDAIVDYRALSDALGLGGRMSVVPGTEVTSTLRGHFNVYPLDPAPLEAANGGAVNWWTPPEDTEELFDRIEAAAGPDALVQVNHPRTPGMFDFAAFDRATAMPGRVDMWSWRFDTFELLNGGVDDVEDLRGDWFALLDFGQVRVPTGASDSHYRTIPCGMARTDIDVGTDDPAGVTPDAVRAALRAGHVVVASGTTLRVSAAAGAAGPGDTVTGGLVEVHATVQAPSWLEPGTLRIWQGGVVVVEQAVPDASAGVVRLDESWTLTAAEDTWVVAEVRGEAPQGDLWRNATPYAAANAIFVDVDGDGWEAPLPWFE